MPQSGGSRADGGHDDLTCTVCGAARGRGGGGGGGGGPVVPWPPRVGWPKGQNLARTQAVAAQEAGAPEAAAAGLEASGGAAAAGAGTEHCCPAEGDRGNSAAARHPEGGARVWRDLERGARRSPGAWRGHELVDASSPADGSGGRKDCRRRCGGGGGGGVGAKRGCANSR
eukprot:SM000358S13185  [mRNA]  locus=s358:19685:20270:- [translate_table: standard]